MTKPAMGLLAAAVLTGRAAVGAEISCESMRVTLDESAGCAVSSVVTAGGVTLADASGRVPLFEIVLVGTADHRLLYTNDASKATSCRAEPQDGGVRIVYSGFAEGLDSVVCTVRPDGDRIRWNIGATPKGGWAVERTVYPRLKAVAAIGAKGEDDAVVWGHAKGGIYRDPVTKGTVLEGAVSPGLLAVQMCCYYDSDALLYMAAEDGVGDVKQLDVRGGDGGLSMAFTRIGFDTAAFALDYDVVTAAIDRNGGDELTWHDAADLYRNWAERQSWCKSKTLDRTDLPSWLKDAPAMVRVRRDWLQNPDDIRAWVNGYFRRQFPDVPLVMDYFGWEHYGMWCSSYFPPYPSEASFRRLLADMRAADAHAYLWPSGYHFTLSYYKIGDGWLYDGREDFERIGGDSVSVWNRDGTPWRLTPGGSWLQGGTMACLCGGLDAVQGWWNEDVCRPIAELGAELVQADQIVGGAFPPCWNPAHGHPPGEGRWKTECFRRQLGTMLATVREVQPDGVVTYEEANELFNDLIGLQLARGDESNADDWANPYTYIYHEWLVHFFEYPMRDNLITPGYSAAEGLMPHFAMGRTDLADVRDGYDAFMANWVRFYHGPARDFLAHGRELKPPKATAFTRRLCERPVSSSASTNGVLYVRRMRPDIFHSRWRAADGRQALVLVNSCDTDRSITLPINGRSMTFDLAAYELRLVPETRIADDGWDLDGEWYVVGRKDGSLAAGKGYSGSPEAVYDVAVADHPDWAAIAADRWVEPGRKKLRIDGYAILDQIPQGLFSEIEIREGSFLILNVNEESVFADGSKQVVPPGTTVQLLPGTWTMDGGRHWLTAGIRKADGTAATVVGSTDMEINGTLLEQRYDEASTCASQFNILHNYNSRNGGDGTFKLAGWGKQLYLSQDFTFTGDLLLDNIYGGWMFLTSANVSGPLRSLRMLGNQWSFRDNQQWCAEGLVFGPPTGSPADSATLDVEDLYSQTAEFSGGHRYGNNLIVYGGRRVRVGTFSGSLHVMAHRADQYNVRDWVRDIVNYFGTGRLAVDEMTTDAKLCISTNVCTTVGTMNAGAKIDYTCQSDGVNTMTLDVTNACDATATVSAPHLAMLPKRLSGFAGKVVLANTDEKAYAMTIDTSRGTAAGDYNAVGCVGSGTLAQAPAKGTLNVTLSGEPVAGAYALARFDAGGELLDGWTVNLLNVGGDGTYAGKKVRLVRDSTGLWLLVTEKTVFGRMDGSLTADSDGVLWADAEWPDWGSCGCAPGAKASFVGCVIIDEIPAGLFSSVDFSLAKTVVLHSSRAFADGAPLVIPEGVTVDFEPRAWSMDPATGKYALPTTYSSVGTYEGDVVLDGTYRLGYHNEQEIRTKFPGSFSGGGSIVVANWSEQMWCYGPEFGFTGDIRFDPGYGSFVLISSRAVTGAISAYETPVGGSWNSSCRNNSAYSSRGLVFGPGSAADAATCTRELRIGTFRGYANHEDFGGTRWRYGDTVIVFGGRRVRIGKLTGGFHALADCYEQQCSGQRAGQPGLLRSVTYFGTGEVEVDEMSERAYVFPSPRVSVTAGRVGPGARFDYTSFPGSANDSTLTVVGACDGTAQVRATDLAALPARISGFTGAVDLTDTDEKTYAVTLDLSKGPENGDYNVGGCIGSGRLASAPEKGTINVTLAGDAPVPGDYAVVRFASGGERLAGWTVSLVGARDGLYSPQGRRRAAVTVDVVRNSTGIFVRACKPCSTLVIMR